VFFTVVITDDAREERVLRTPEERRDDDGDDKSDTLVRNSEPCDCDETQTTKYEYCCYRILAVYPIQDVTEYETSDSSGNRQQSRRRSCGGDCW